MKTIKELNTKVWYRFLKICYAICFITILSIVVFIIYNENFPVLKLVNDYETVITCNYGNKKQFIASNVHIYFKKSEVAINNRYLTEDHRVALQDLCEISETELDQKSDNILNNTDDGTKLFDVNFVMRSIGGIGPFLGQTSLVILGLLVIFEIIKRVFYYIILGSFRPKKIGLA